MDTEETFVTSWAQGVLVCDFWSDYDEYLTTTEKDHLKYEATIPWYDVIEYDNVKTYYKRYFTCVLKEQGSCAIVAQCEFVAFIPGDARDQPYHLNVVWTRISIFCIGEDREIKFQFGEFDLGSISRLGDCRYCKKDIAVTVYDMDASKAFGIPEKNPAFMIGLSDSRFIFNCFLKEADCSGLTYEYRLEAYFKQEDDFTNIKTVVKDDHEKIYYNNQGKIYYSPDADGAGRFFGAAESVQLPKISKSEAMKRMRELIF